MHQGINKSRHHKGWCIF